MNYISGEIQGSEDRYCLCGPTYCAEPAGHEEIDPFLIGSGSQDRGRLTIWCGTWLCSQLECMAEATVLVPKEFVPKNLFRICTVTTRCIRGDTGRMDPC